MSESEYALLARFEANDGKAEALAGFLEDALAAALIADEDELLASGPEIAEVDVLAAMHAD